MARGGYEGRGSRRRTKVGATATASSRPQRPSNDNRHGLGSFAFPDDDVIDSLGSVGIDRNVESELNAIQNRHIHVGGDKKRKRRPTKEKDPLAEALQRQDQLANHVEATGRQREDSRAQREAQQQLQKPIPRKNKDRHSTGSTSYFQSEYSNEAGRRPLQDRQGAAAPPRAHHPYNDRRHSSGSNGAQRRHSSGGNGPQSPSVWERAKNMAKNKASSVYNSVTSGLRGRFSPPSSRKSSPSRKRPRESSEPPKRKVAEVVDLCGSDDEETNDGERAAGDDESTTTERSEGASRSSTSASGIKSRTSTGTASTASRPSQAETPHSPKSHEDSRASSSSSTSQSSGTPHAVVVDSSSSSTRYRAPDMSDEDFEKVQEAAVGTPPSVRRLSFGDSQGSSSEETKKPSAASQPFAWQDHFGGDSESSPEKARKSICEILSDDDEAGESKPNDVTDMIENISREPYGAAQQRKKTSAASEPSAKKARTAKDPPRPQRDTDGIGNDAPWFTKRTEAPLGLSKANNARRRKQQRKPRGAKTALKPAAKPPTKITIGASVTGRSDDFDDPIVDSSDDEVCKTQRRKRLRKGTELSSGVNARNFHAKNSGHISTRKNPSRRAKKSTRTSTQLVFDENDDDEPMGRYDARGDVAVFEVVEAVRVAIGKKVFNTRCKLEFTRLKNDKRSLTLSYDKTEGSRVRHVIDVDDSSIREMKYYLADEEDDGNGTTISIDVDDFDESERLSFLAMQVDPDDKNGFKTFSNAYVPNAKASSAANKRYIAVEFRSNSDFRIFLNVMKKDDVLSAFVGESSKLSSDNAEEYGKTLIDAAKKERADRESSVWSPPTRRTRRARRGGKPSNEVLVVFPFGADEEKIDQAAEGLTELAFHNAPPAASVEDRKPAAKPSGEAAAAGLDSSDGAELPDNDNEKDGSNAGRRARVHHLTIREEDVDRLQPGEFLNDTLIDFWMQWMWRKARHSLEDCNVHFFSSHFYTTLAKDGPKAVTAWTERKGINIFTKDFVFIPVNQSLHWSLCIVVHPGAIENNKKQEPGKPYACLLFFDSLRAHRKATVASNIRLWLNSEWKRIKETQDEPFDPHSLRVFDPTVPYQDNSWDCGVYVCRYAHGMYSLRNEVFTFEDAKRGDGIRPFQRAVTESDAFDFDRNDIARIRTEMGDLIDRLSAIYRPWKAASDLAEKEARRKAKQAAKAAAAANSPLLEAASAATGIDDGVAEALDLESKPSAMEAPSVTSNDDGETTAMDLDSKPSAIEAPAASSNDDGETTAMELDDSNPSADEEGNAPMEYVAENVANDDDEEMPELSASI